MNTNLFRHKRGARNPNSHEAANDEVRGSYEEVQSANEELQRINEKLETAKKELRSTNQELITVYEELAKRNGELNRLNADLNNLHGGILVDIDDLKRTEQEVRAARDYAEAIIRTAHDPLLVLREDFRVNTANEAFYRTFKTDREHTEGCSIFHLAGGALDIPKFRHFLEDVLPLNSFFDDFEITHDFPHLGLRTMLLNARRLDIEVSGPRMILLAVTDITERLQADISTASLAAIVDSSEDAIVGKDLNGIIRSWNHGAERLFGYSAREAIGQPITMLIPPERLSEEPDILERLKRGERVEHFETVRLHKNGSRLEISLTISPIRDRSGRVGHRWRSGGQECW